MPQKIPLLHRLHILVLLGLAVMLSGCGKPKDPFTLTVKDVDSTVAPSLGGGYRWSSANLGATINGHGLPDSIRTFVITHTSDDGKSELIWPVFIYGNDEANAAVLGDTIVFSAELPDGRVVLMADRPGETPLVISAAALRIAAQRLGTSVIVPDKEYQFTQVRLPPDRVWLAGNPADDRSYYHEKTFTVELTTSDLARAMDETKQKGKRFTAGKFGYIAEDGVPRGITAADVAALGIPEVGSNGPAAPVIHKTTGYAPQEESLKNGTVLLDCSNQYAYFSTIHQPARILKVTIGGDLTAAPVVVGAAVFEGDENDTFDAVMDPRGGYAYFATDYPGHVVKVALGDGNQPPYRVGSVLIDKDENVRLGVMDTSNGHLFFNVRNNLYELDSGEGDAAPKVISKTALPDQTMDDVASLLIDPANRHLYLANGGDDICKLTLGDDKAPPQMVSKSAVAGNAGGLLGAMIDTQAGYAWFTGNDGYILKFSLGQGDEPPKQIGAAKVDPQFDYLQYTFGRDNDGYGYVGSMGGGKANDPVERIDAILKVALGKNNAPPKIVSYLPLPRGYSIISGAVDPVHRALVVGMNFASDDPNDACCKIVKFDLGQGDAPPKMMSEVKLAK